MNKKFLIAIKNHSDSYVRPTNVVAREFLSTMEDMAIRFGLALAKGDPNMSSEALCKKAWELTEEFGLHKMKCEEDLLNELDVLENK
jgi:hypothetical protein